MIHFTIPAIPIAQPRQRTRVAFISGKPRAMNYTPTKNPANVFKATCRLALSQAYVGAPLAGPVCLRVLFVMPRPKNRIWKKRAMPREWHDKKPDAENLVKSLQDAITGLAYIDDSQVCRLEATKMIAGGDESAHAEVWIERIEWKNPEGDLNGESDPPTP